MNFNQLANVISENITSTIVASEEMEGARGRAPNPEIEKLVSQGLPYWKARAMVRKGLTGAAEDKPVITSIVPKASTSGTSAERAKTQSAVDDYVSANPDATLDGVVAHLKALNDTPLGIKTSYIVAPKEVASMLSVAKGEESEEAEFDPEAEKKAKFERLRKFLKLSRKERDQFLKRKAKDISIKDTEEDEDEDEDEVDPYVRSYLSGMKKRRDDVEDFEPLEND
jgi:hypothetical protein